MHVVLKIDLAFLPNLWSTESKSITNQSLLKLCRYAIYCSTCVTVSCAIALKPWLPSLTTSWPASKITSDCATIRSCWRSTCQQPSLPRKPKSSDLLRRSRWEQHPKMLHPRENTSCSALYLAINNLVYDWIFCKAQ